MSATATYPPKSLRELERWMDRVSDRRSRPFSYIRVAFQMTPVIAALDLDGKLYALVTPETWRRMVWGGASKMPEGWEPRLERFQNMPVIYEPGACGR